MGPGGHYESSVVKMFGDAWIPHGEGEHRVRDRVFLKSYFDRGIPMGRSIIEYENGETWDCTFKAGDMQGVARVTRPEIREKLREVLAEEHRYMEDIKRAEQSPPKLLTEPAPTVKNCPPGAKVINYSNNIVSSYDTNAFNTSLDNIKILTNVCICIFHRCGYRMDPPILIQMLLYATTSLFVKRLI